MNPTIKNSLANSFLYQEYRNYVSELVKSGKTTGNEQNQKLICKNGICMIKELVHKKKL